MKKLTKKQVQNRGMILTEVLVAIGGLMTALFVLSSIMSSAWSTVAASKNMLIAQNLATEAIEGVKNLRDTNKLLVPNDKTCWLRTDPAAADCTLQAVEGSSYVVKQNSTGQWIIFGGYLQMLDINDAGGIDGGDGDYLMKVVEIGDDLNGYKHGEGLDASIFYRGVKFNVVEEEFATFEVLVQWMEGAKVKEIRQEVTIFNE